MKKYHLRIRDIMPVCPLMCFEIVHEHIGKGGRRNVTHYDFNTNLPTRNQERLTRPVVGGQHSAERGRELSCWKNAHCGFSGNTCFRGPQLVWDSLQRVLAGWTYSLQMIVMEKNHRLRGSNSALY